MRMRRIFGFTLGIAIGLGIVYAGRRFLGQNGAAQNNNILATPTVKAPGLETTDTASVQKPTSIGDSTVETQGLQSQPAHSTSADDEVKVDTNEPVAVQETDEAAASSRAEIETIQELATANDSQSQEVSAPTESEPATEEMSAATDSELATEEVSAPTESEPTTQDDLRVIRGIGEVTAQKLQAAGVNTFAQLATLPLDELEQITEFNETRIQRDKLIEQAEALAKGEKYDFPEEAVG